MPTAGDAFLPSALPITHNPLNRISFDPFALIPDLADLLQTVVTWIEDFFFPAFKQLTGIDLSPFLAEIQSLISNLEVLFGPLTGSGTFDPNAAIQAFINICIDLGINFPLALIQDMGGFTGGIPVLSQLISALTGGNVAGTAGLSGLASFFNFGTGSTSIIGVIESMISSIPGVGPLIDTFLTFLTGTTSSGGTLSDLSGALPNLPLIGPLLNLLTGSPTTGGGGLGALGSVFTDLFGLLGNPVGLGTGAAGLGTGSIPILGPLIDTIANGFGSAGSGFSLTSLLGILEAIPGVGNLIDTLMNALGVGGTGFNLTDLLGTFGNLFGLLGSPTGLGSGGGFDLFGAASGLLQDILAPAGALSTFSQLPGHLFGLLAPNNLTNLLPENGGFTNPNYFADPANWSNLVGFSAPFGVLKLVANGAYQQFLGVPIGSDASQVTNFGIYTMWQSLVATTGQVINLAVDAFDSGGNLIPNPTGRIVNSISNPTTNSATYGGAPTQQPPVPAPTTGADGNKWVYLSGPYMPPAGTSYISISPEITTNAQSGTTYFDDAYQMPDQGLIDSSIISNFENMLDGSIPGSKVAGLQGISDIVGALQHHVDGLYNAFIPGSSSASNVLFSDLFDIAAQMASASINAQSLSAGNRNLLTNVLNKAPILGGVQPSGEANFTHATMPDTTTMPTSTLTSGNGMAGWIRASQTVSKGFIDLFAAKTASTSNIYVNLYTQNTTTGAKTRVWTSGDVASVFPNTTPGWAQVLIPGGVNVNANDVVWMEIYNNSGSNMTVAKRSTPFTDNPNVYPRNVGHTRTSTLGTAPASLTTSDYTTSQTAPIFTIGVASVPADYHVPEQQTYPPGGSGAGNYLFTIPSWVMAGDTIDLVGVGGGGSGMSEWDAGIMAGGLGGSWNAARFVFYSDPNSTGLTVIPTGTTKLQCAVGAGGPHPGGYWANGNAGSATVWTCYDGPSAGTVLLTCAGGVGGSNSVGLSPGTGYGPTPNPYTWQGKSYTAGANVGVNQTGAPPGGGGGGATWYEFGGSGAPGGGWTNTMKAT